MSATEYSLRQLKARFIRYEIRPCSVGAPGCNVVSPHTEHAFSVNVETLAEAEGLIFLCPKCFAVRGEHGCHSVICWFRGRVPDDRKPGPGRWTPSGTGLDDLTFAPGDPPMLFSVRLEGDCGWHGFIRDGQGVA